MTYATASHINRGKQYTLKASSAETASTTGHAKNTANDSGSLYVFVNVTAVTGTTPTMTVVIEGSQDGSNWFTLGTVGANGYATGTTATAPSNFTAAADTRAAFPAMQFIRSRSVIGGTTPSFTYSVIAAVM